jgi:hypothetical protein
VSLAALKVKVAGWGPLNPDTPANTEYTPPVAETVVMSPEVVIVHCSVEIREPLV